MVDGFELQLEDYCQYCPMFEPDVDKTDITSYSDKTKRYITVIQCRSKMKCEIIADRMKKR